MLRPLILAAALVSASASAPQPTPVVHLAELEIDPAQLEPYLAALRLEIQTSVRMEPGVLNLYAVSLKDHPNQIRLFEQYRDQQAYQAHLASSHFLKYKADTAGMVKHLSLTDAEPILPDISRAN